MDQFCPIKGSGTPLIKQAGVGEYDIKFQGVLLFKQY